MRIIFMGQQAFGKASLEKILTAGIDEVVAVYAAPDKKGRPFDPVKQTALDNDIPLFQPANFEAEATLDQMRSHNADLMIMAYVTVFVPKAARDIPKMGSICFHPSLLPLHRGPSSINWPIMWGETVTGYSWFYPSDGLDEGDILLQREVSIGPDDTLGDVYFEKIYPAAIVSTLEVIDAFRSGNPPRSAQDEAKATYESWCKKSDVELDWRETNEVVYNKIRAGNPQPGAWTVFDGTEVQIYDSRRQDGDGEPSEIVSVSDDGVLVQANGGRIIVKRVRPKGGDKMPAAQWASSLGVSAGARLGR